jgi:hypothetical protein
MFAKLPPSSSELTELKSVVPASPPADRRREHRESAYFVVARTGSRAAVLRRSEPTRFSSCLFARSFERRASLAPCGGARFRRCTIGQAQWRL